jgi:WD40 repeat protein
VALQYYSPTRARIVLYDASTSRRLGSLDVTESDAWRPFFSLDGRMLTFGSFKGGAFAIDIEQVLSGTRMADAVVLNPRIGGGPTTFTVAGGEHLVTGHSGETLRFWDLETKELWLSLPVDTGDSTMIAFTPDDRYLYYEARGGVLKRFPLDSGELVALARSRVQRDFSEDECDRFLIDSDCSAYAT